MAAFEQNPAAHRLLSPAVGFASLYTENNGIVVPATVAQCRPKALRQHRGLNTLGWELKGEASWKRKIYRGLYCSQHVWEVSLLLSVMTCSSIQIYNPDSYSCQSVGLYRWLNLVDLSKVLLLFFSLGMRVMLRFTLARQSSRACDEKKMDRLKTRGKVSMHIFMAHSTNMKQSQKFIYLPKWNNMNRAILDFF